MNDLKSVVTSLESKIEKLVDLHHRTKKELSNLKTQNTILKLSKSLSTTNENTTELKLKINELIREVDKCIALLNK